LTAAEASPQRLRLIMAALVAAVLLASLDGMIFNTALPTIVGQLHGIGRMSWVPTAYLLTTAITMPVYGKLGDLAGRKWLFVAAGYLPTYLQMVDGLTPSIAGLFMVPMVAGIGTTSFASGHLMSRTGRYAWMPVAGAVVVAAALGLLSLLSLSTPPWVVGADAYLFGAGMGFGMQTLVIVAQNAFPAEVGTATASFAFFRKIGAALGAAAVGGLFTARLTALLAARLPVRLADAHALTPASVAAFPADLRQRVGGAYHDALIPVFRGLAPMMLGAALLLLFVREHSADAAPLAEATPAPIAEELASRGGEP
jgi:MFS family permease